MSVQQQLRTAAHTAGSGASADAPSTDVSASAVVTTELTMPAASTAAAAVQTRRNTAAQLVVRLAVLALPLLSLVVLHAIASLHAPPREASGDPLRDAFTREVDAAGSLPWSSALLEHFNSAAQLNGAVPYQQLWTGHASVLDHLDEHFTSDPRYWQLLYQGARFAPPAAAAVDLRTRGLEPAAWFLEEAQRRGVVSVPLLISLLHAEDGGWKHMGLKSAPVPQTVAGPDNKDWPQKQWRDNEAEFKASSAGQLDRLLDQLLQTGAGDAAAYYTAAFYEAERGDHARATQLLEQGNQCPTCSAFTALDPVVAWQNQLGQAWLADDLAFGRFAGRPAPNYVRWKTLVKKLALDAAQHGDRAGLQTLHTFACRFAQNGDPGLLTQMVGLSMTDLLLNALRDFSPQPLSLHDLQGLVQAAAKRDALRAQYKLEANLSGRRLVAQYMGWQAIMARAAEGALGGPECAQLDDLKSDHAYAHDQWTDLHTNAPLWADLASFDYRMMSAPPATAPAAPPPPRTASLPAR